VGCLLIVILDAFKTASMLNVKSLLVMLLDLTLKLNGKLDYINFSTKGKVKTGTFWQQNSRISKVT
jgi:hypothetical protein